MPKLTKSFIDRIETPEKECFIWDDGLKGFGIRVSTSGAKSYVFQYRVGGGRGATMRRPRIGAVGSITPAQARDIAEGWAADVAKGLDPSGERQAQRDAPRMDKLFERYMSDHAETHKKSSSIEEDKRLIRIFLLPSFARRKVIEVNRADITDFHKSLSDKPYRANRCIALLSKAFNLAEVWGWRPDASNPCRHVKKYKEDRRERFLSQKELVALGASLAKAENGELQDEHGKAVAINPYSVAAIRLLIFTGARRGEILGLQWKHVNFEMSRLELPDSKTGAKFVYLSAPALKILQELPRVENNPFVIVGGKAGAALVNLKDPWAIIRHDAGLDDMRLHDLRHSFASFGAAGGMSLPVIGKLLGHRDTATTARYAHLSDDPLRIAVNSIGDHINQAIIYRTTN